jgi:hypothetical protein
VPDQITVPAPGKPAGMASESFRDRHGRAGFRRAFVDGAMVNANTSTHFGCLSSVVMTWLDRVIYLSIVLMAMARSSRVMTR